MFESLFNNVPDLKETDPTQVFPVKFAKLLGKPFIFYRTPLLAASVNLIYKTIARKKDIRNILLLQTNDKYRGSCSQMFFKISVLKNFTNFTGKHLCWILIFNKVTFPVKFEKV